MTAVLKAGGARLGRAVQFGGQRPPVQPFPEDMAEGVGLSKASLWLCLLSFALEPSALAQGSRTAFESPEFRGLRAGRCVGGSPHLGDVAEGVGFEPTRAFALPVFKTGAINHSTTPPC